MKMMNYCKLSLVVYHVIFVRFNSYAIAFTQSSSHSIQRQHKFEKQQEYFKGRSARRESSTELKGEIAGTKNAIVIGGGPVGLASALMLANAPHCYNVTVYEATDRMTSQSRCIFDPALAYLYNVNARGQRFTKAFPFIHEHLIEKSVAASQTKFVLSPANLDDEIITRSVPSMSDEESYWIPRHEMVNLLQDAIDDHNAKERMKKASADSQNDGLLGRIEVQSGMECMDVCPEMTSSFCKVKVVLENKEGGTVTSTANLVVAADGIHSKVRQSLLEGSKVFANWNNFKVNRFKVKKWMSPASGLRLKALQLPANFTLQQSGRINDRGTKEVITMQNNNIVAIRGLKNGPRDFLSLGCLPMKDGVMSRPANAITRPDHVLWTLKTGEQVQKWYEENFPRMSFQKEEYGGIVSTAEWERFAQAEGTTFPPCQYTPGLQASSSDGKCGIVLLGDSAHSFPPDIGQGINAGFADVVQFNNTLSTVNGDLGDVLKEYERVRAPETRALIRIARFGAPYQYNQPHRIDRLRKKLFTINFALRLLLNKVSFGLIPKPMIAAMANPKLSYLEVAKRADATTFVISMVLIKMMSILFAPTLRSFWRYLFN